MKDVTIGSRLTSRGGVATGPVIILLSLALIAVIGTRPDPPVQNGAAGGASAASSRPIGESPAGPAARGSELGRTPLAGAAYRLAYDPTHDAIWYATFDISGPDYLYRVDVATAKTSRYGLPDTDYNGYLSAIRIAPDGAVWLNEPYRLVRFDPDAGSTKTLEFDLDDPAAQPDALDQGNPVPGTWISTFALADDSIIVARNNVSQLTLLSYDLKQIGTIPIPRAYAGARDLAVGPGDGQIYALPGVGQVGGLVVLSNAGAVLSTPAIEGNRLELVGGDVFLSRPAGGTWVTGRRVSAPLAGPAVAQDSFAVAGANGDVILFDATAGTLEKVTDGRVVSMLQLPRSEVAIPRPGGENIVAHVAARVSDLVTDRHGVTWYVDAGTNELVQAQL